MLPTYCLLRAPCGGAGVGDTFPGLRVLLGEVCHPLIPPPMGTVSFALRAGFPLPSPAVICEHGKTSPAPGDPTVYIFPLREVPAVPTLCLLASLQPHPPQKLPALM